MTRKTKELTRAPRNLRSTKKPMAYGHKLLYFGSPYTQYGVGIAISEGFREAIKEVERLTIFEPMVDNCTREIVEITVNQTGLVKNCATNAIDAARLLTKKHRHLYVGFLDIAKMISSNLSKN